MFETAQEYGGIGFFYTGCNYISFFYVITDILQMFSRKTRAWFNVDLSHSSKIDITESIGWFPH